MNNDEIIGKAREALGTSDLIAVDDIIAVNYKPHPYMITDKHLERNEDSMYIGGSQIRSMERKYGPMCGFDGCNLFIDQHTYDTVMTLKLLRNGTRDEALPILQDLSKVLSLTEVDGFVFLETDEKYRIT